MKYYVGQELVDREFSSSYVTRVERIFTCQGNDETLYLIERCGARVFTVEEMRERFMVVDEEKVHDFKLTVNLTAQEAGALLTVTHNIAGHPNGPRGLTNTIGAALRRAGVTSNSDRYRQCGSIIMQGRWLDGPGLATAECEKL